MSGVIDDKGVQWEHCSACQKFVRLDDLGYEPPSSVYPHGRDICLDCTNAHEHIEVIVPASMWLEVEIIDYSETPLPM